MTFQETLGKLNDLWENSGENWGAGDQPGKLGGSVIPSLTPANEKTLHKYLHFREPQFSHVRGSKIIANDLLESSQLQISPN